VSDPRLTVLVAAAEDEALKAISAAFPHDRFAPLAARGWAQIEASLGARPLAAALVYYKLLDIGSLDFCARLRSLPGRARLPIIVLVPGVGRAPKPDEPFDIAMRFPAAPGVLADNLAKVVAGSEERVAAARAELEADVTRLTRGLEAKSYYEILEIPRSAGRDAIKAAYDGFSLRLHPDRLKRLDAQSELYRAAARFYLLVTEAYQTLLDPTKRKRYHDGLASGRLRYDPTQYKTISDPGQITDVDNAKRYLRLAQKELDRGDPKAAVVFLKMARAVDPDNPNILERLQRAQGAIR
jgi:DnaJ-domain-containing protein 1